MVGCAGGFSDDFSQTLNTEGLAKRRRANGPDWVLTPRRRVRQWHMERLPLLNGTYRFQPSFHYCQLQNASRRDRKLAQ